MVGKEGGKEKGRCESKKKMSEERDQDDQLETAALRGAHQKRKRKKNKKTSV